MKKLYKVTYVDYADADSKEEALEIAFAAAATEHVFKEFAKVAIAKSEGEAERSTSSSAIFAYPYGKAEGK